MRDVFQPFQKPEDGTKEQPATPGFKQEGNVPVTPGFKLERDYPVTH